MNFLQKKYGSEPKWFRKLFAKQPGVKALQGRRLSLPLAQMHEGITFLKSVLAERLNYLFIIR
jgi:hypothetical protein